MCVTEKMAEGWQNLDVAPGDVPKQRGPSHWSAYVLAGRRPSAATTWLRRAAGESGCSPLSRTTSAIDRRSEKAIAQSGLVLLGFDCRKKRHRLRKCLVSDPVPQRGTPALVGRSVFIANLLFTDDQVSRPDQQIPDRWSFCRNRFALRKSRSHGSSSAQRSSVPCVPRPAPGPARTRSAVDFHAHRLRADPPFCLP